MRCFAELSVRESLRIGVLKPRRCKAFKRIRWLVELEEPLEPREHRLAIEVFPMHLIAISLQARATRV